jgi:hypothetical protein
VPRKENKDDVPPQGPVGEPYEVVLVVKGAKSHIVSPTTMSRADAEHEIEIVRKAQAQNDTPPVELPWITVRGTDVISAYAQSEERRPRDTRSAEEILDSIARRFPQLVAEPGDKE